MSDIFKNIIKAFDESETKVQSIEKQKQARIRNFRKEASRLSAMANKRLQRIEKAGLKNSPAYEKWIDEGGEKFSVRGKSFNEVQQEVARVRRFLDSKTSTIRGMNQVLKDMAKNTGIEYKNLNDLRKNASTFFELSSKVEQYLRNVEDMASAIGYQKIWQAVNEYIKKERIDLSQSKDNIDDMVKKIIKGLDVYEEQEKFTVQKPNVKIDTWFKLDK